jgi:ATP-dependent exoDNAse (exonuclease V) beta subunit
VPKFTAQKSFAISAGAGSGKTYTLSRRYINALLGFDYFFKKTFVNILEVP